MEGESGDPYEEQLLAVFNSCLEKGHTELRSEGLRALCEKLQLEEQSQELISCLSAEDVTFVTFATFRDGLLKLLGQTQGRSQSFDGKDTADESLQRSRAAGSEAAKFEQRSQVSQGPSPENSPGRVNGMMNGEIDHSEMCGLSGIGYATVPKEMLEQIFEKLDMDCDGLISFDEFILLFENDKNTHEQQTLDWGNGSSCDVIKSRDSQNVVHILGPHQTGYARISTIVSMWEVAGVTDAATLLSELGFTSTEIRLTDLTTVLCEELKSLRDEPDNAITSTHMSLLKGALTLYQEEVRCMNTLVEHLSGERDKLRIDVAEANERANLLAQEIDEHHVRLEKSRQEQLKQLELRHAEITRDLSIQCTSEREAHTAALKALDRQLQVVQNEEQQVRAKLANVLRENQALENEIEKCCDQIAKLKSSNGQLLMQVQHLAAEHEEIDTSDDNQESEQIIQLVDRIKRLQSDIALLRDQNDELTTELEFTKNRIIETRPIDVVTVDDRTTVALEKSSDDSLEESSERHRGSSNGWCKKSQPDDTKLSDLSNTIATIIRELKSLLNSKNQCISDYCEFRSNISSIITGLESNLPLTSFARIVTDDETCNVAETKIFAENELECEERASESLRDLVIVQHEKSKLVKCRSHSDDTINVIDKNFNNLDARCPAKSKITSLRDYPPRKDETTSLEIVKIDKDRVAVATNFSQTLNSVDNIRESFDLRIQEEEAKHVNETKQLAERCAELESSLDLLRTEYEQCEDYWAAKLEEERQLFEQEQKISDDKFSELIGKMAEYEEQFGNGDGKSRNDGRLSPIEEKFNLEQQYADLEDDYDDLKRRTGELLSQRENEIRELQDRLSREKRILPSLTDASTQIFIDETKLENIPKRDISSLPLRVIDETLSRGDSHSCSLTTTNYPSTTKKLLHHGTINQRIFDPSKLNQIAESTMSNTLYTIPSTKLRDCYCQQIEAYNSMEELCRVHKAELHRLYEKKLEIDNECVNLIKQKEWLMKDVTELKNVAIINPLCPTEDGAESTCSLSINVLKALNERLQAQEKKRRNLKISLNHQQHQAERILQQTWQQHCQEVAALRFALQGTKEQLKKQVQINQEQSERLAKADILSTDLYVQNAHMMASIKRLEQHCHILAQFGGESTSV